MSTPSPSSSAAWKLIGPNFVENFPDIILSFLRSSKWPEREILQFRDVVRAAIRALPPLSSSLDSGAGENESLHSFVTHAFPVFAEALFRKHAQTRDIPRIYGCFALIFRLVIRLLPLEIEALASLVLLLMGGGQEIPPSEGLTMYIASDSDILVPGGLYQEHGRPIRRR